MSWLRERGQWRELACRDAVLVFHLLADKALLNVIPLHSQRNNFSKCRWVVVKPEWPPTTLSWRVLMRLVWSAVLLSIQRLPWRWMSPCTVRIILVKVVDGEARKHLLSRGIGRLRDGNLLNPGRLAEGEHVGHPGECVHGTVVGTSLVL